MRYPTTLTLTAVLGLSCGMARAQDVLQAREPGPAEPPVKHTIEFVRSEFGPVGPLVKGAPYSAEAVTETVQMLADGNRIVRKTSAQVARDGEGRTRRDVTVAGLGPVAPAEAPKISVIHDPVRNVSYTLEHSSRTARRMEGRGMMFHMSTPPENAMPVTAARRVIALRGEPGGAPIHAQQDVVIERVPGPGWAAARQPAGKEESLGKRNVEGVMAEGTRTVTVIPAGQIGNERPIEIVSERWYSPELQAVVMSSHRDPRTGETTYKLTGLRLGEPPPSMFEPPADYTVKAAEAPVPDIPAIRMRQP